MDVLDNSTCAEEKATSLLVSKNWITTVSFFEAIKY